MTTALASATLTAADRCDRCGAQAYVRAVLPSGELLFCAHHARKHSDALRAAAIEITDESDRLESVTSTAPLDER